MNKYFRTMNRVLLWALLLPFASFAQTHRAYADELFKKGDYYHAFFLYRNLYGTNLSENQFAQRCNQAIALTKQFLDLKASKQYYDAKTKLRELLEINPDDFHAPMLAQMSVEEATYWHKLALKQTSAKEVNLMLEKAISLYEQGKADGWNYKEIDDAIKQCEVSKTQSGIDEVAKMANLTPKVEITPTQSVEPQTIAQELKTEVVAAAPNADVVEIPAIQLKEETIKEKKVPNRAKIVKTKPKRALPKREVASRQ